MKNIFVQICEGLGNESMYRSLTGSIGYKEGLGQRTKSGGVSCFQSRSLLVFPWRFLHNDCVLTAYPELDPNLDPVQFTKKISQGKKWHRDMQHKFLFVDLYGWCKGFVSVDDLLSDCS